MEFQAATLETKELENVFVEYAKATFGDNFEEDDVIAIDGKTECNSQFSQQPGTGKSHLESASVR